ncbi:MAG: hypothetical protein LUE98_00995 [Tannerellaceae bacterium]|nr:hypothetical protein [Tannerellaceae bacterium]
MKSKLRKIIIDESEYLYSVTETYMEKEVSKLTINIYLSGCKQTPLVIEFLTLDDYFLGQPLTKGICMKNRGAGRVDKVNLHEPGYIRKLILLGFDKGWTGENKIPRQDGLAYLAELGYEIYPVLPGTK